MYAWDLKMRAPIFAAGIAILAGLARAGEHWAYVPPVEARVPAGAVDGFLAEAWEKAGLEPAELAPPREWIERAAYTLTGLPASLEQIRRI